MKNKEIEELLNELKDVAKRNTIEVKEYGVIETISSSIAKELRLNNYSANLLLSYIEQLEKKVGQYENPDDLTLFYMWLDTKAKDKMKQLEKENDRLKKDYSIIVNENCDNLLLEKKVEQLQNNRDKAIEILYKRKHVENLFGGVENSNTDKIIHILKGDSDE